MGDMYTATPNINHTLFSILSILRGAMFIDVVNWRGVQKLIVTWVSAFRIIRQSVESYMNRNILSHSV